MFHSDFNITFANPFIKGLACAAITPGLRSVLIFDASYADLDTAATILAQMLKCATDREVKRVQIGVSELDDDLWGSFILSNDRSDSPVIWHQGAVAGAWSDPYLRIVMIPDLAKLSLAAARTCLMLVGADVAHLERHGQSERWQPNICWLASCARSEVGHISPHLLDRFTLRLNRHNPSPLRRAADLLSLIFSDESHNDVPQVLLPSSIKERLQDAVQNRAFFTNEGVTRVLHFTPTSQMYVLRRELALARLAQAVAQLERASLVSTSHVDTAASLMGLTSVSQQSEGNSQLDTDQPLDTAITEQGFQFKDPSDQPPSSLSIAGEVPLLLSAQSDEGVNAIEPVYESSQTIILDTITSLSANPYPEDGTPVEREFASLRLPPLQYTMVGSGRGAVIGVERATSLRDLALVNTLFAAAPFQPIRRKQLGIDDHRVLLVATDLQSYRREPVAEQMLLLLLDYTSLRDCAWQQAILPHLHWAYIERASICIVQIGTENAVNELCAELISTRSILAPSIAEALEARPGKATPLAHGFDLALRTLHHAMEHGRSTIQRARLVVISDGRGNIPLAASRKRQIVGPVNREGIEDALQVAQHIRDLKGVQTILLNPQPKYYHDLPLALARSLGAEVKSIQRLDVELVEAERD